MIKLNLFLVGAPKCGTTAMDSYLAAHPDICMSARKELHFFGSDLHSASFTKEPKTYHDNFSHYDGEKVLGESSVWYLYSRNAAREIAEYSPEARILIMLRNPVDMIYSNYYQMLYNGNEHVKPFSKALRLEEERKNGNYIYPGTHFINSLFYLDTAAYYQQVKRYLETFSRSSVKIILFEEFMGNTDAVFREVLDFVEVDSAISLELPVVNANKVVRNDTLNRSLRGKSYVGKWLKGLGKNSWANDKLKENVKSAISRINISTEKRPPLSAEDREYIYSYLKEDIDRLEDLIERDLSSWKNLMPA